MRHVVALAAAVLLGLLAPSPASADRSHDVALVEVPAAPLEAANPTHTIYLNRCVGGCIVRPGDNDASTNHSSLVAQTSNIAEFMYSDTVWDAVVACVANTYAPYDVQVVTTKPSGTDYIEALVAGSPSDIGQPGTTLGYSPMATDCSPQRNWISFCFANIHGTDPVIELCNTIAHETGHVFGLDHTMTCKDPMSYAMGCGQKHFLNLEMDCGETAPRKCKCGDTLNTNHALLDAVGPGTPPPPPTVTIPYPTDGAIVTDHFTVFGDVTEDRVVDRVEFRLNGFPWQVDPGRDDTTSYQYGTDPTLPDGIIDVQVRAYNDLQLEGDATVTVTKGAPCTSASTCLDGQGCNDGRCEYPPPTVALGDACERDADCISYKCESDGDAQLCSAVCVVGDNASCGDGFTCLQAGDHGACWPSDRVHTGGCCSTGGGGAAGSALLALGLVILGRGRRRAAPRC